jgi:anti-sigma-K factor RskA
MNRQRLHDLLAAEYVLGTLHGRARSRFAQRLRDDVALHAQVAYWERALMPMAPHLSATPSPQVWTAIAARMAPRSDVAQPNWIQRWFGVRTFAPLAAGLVLGVALSVIGPGLVDGGVADSSETQLPESYVGVLAGADGRAGLIVSSRRHGKVMDIKQIQPAAVLPGQALFLWVIESDGTTRAIGAVPQGRFVQVTLPKTSEQLFAKATELAVSIEPAGVAPAAPTQPFVYRGLCGKLWRVVAPQK